MYAGNQKHQRQSADFADFADIFYKYLKLRDFSHIHGEDILRMSTRMRIYPRIDGRPAFARKKSLTAFFKRASSSMSLSTGSAFFAAGCCDSRGPFFAEKVSKYDFSFKVQVRKYF